MEELKRKQASERSEAVAPPAPPPVPPAAEAVTSTPAPPPAPVPAGERRVPIAAYVVGGASLVALGVGAAFGVLAIKNDRAADPDCPMDLCNAKGYAAYEASVRDARISDVALGAGLIGAGVAAYLYFTSSPRTSVDGAVVRGVRPTPGAGVAGIGLEASW